MLQDFDKLESILKEYKQFLQDSDSIDMSLPLHAHLAGFDEEGLKIAVHVESRAFESTCVCLHDPWIDLPRLLHVDIFLGPKFLHRERLSQWSVHHAQLP